MIEGRKKWVSVVRKNYAFYLKDALEIVNVFTVSVEYKASINLWVLERVNVCIVNVEDEHIIKSVSTGDSECMMYS